MSELFRQDQAVDTIDDQRLMLSYAKGNTGAFESLYVKHKGALYRYFVRQIGDKQLAEDLYQETWSRVIKSAATYQSTAKFTTWLYRIAHNLLIDHVRSVRSVDLAVELDKSADEEASIAAAQGFALQDSASPEVLLEAGIKAKLLKHCIGLLPMVQKEAFLLNIEMGFTAAIIAQISGVTLEATKSRIRYAHVSLKQCVTNKWQESHHEAR